ncbi:MAG: PfkB family carbohydrate kinase [Gammaproteobacteria bacterium]
MSAYIALGEMMLRLKAPGHERLLQSPSLEASFGGSEANVAISLAYFGCQTSFVTALPTDNLLSDAVIAELRKFGVDTRHIVRQGSRIGTYYMENGANQRPSIVMYDRAGSSMCDAKAADFNWHAIFKEAKWFHISGITPALSASAAELTLAAVKQAQKQNVRVSCDLNYRSKLWKYGVSASEVMQELMQYVNIAIAGHKEDCRQLLGATTQVSQSQGQLDIEGYKALSDEVLTAYPKLDGLAVTLREHHSAHHNTWAACWRDKQGFAYSRQYNITDIVDRVGGGDSFTAALIYALDTYSDRQQALEFAVAASCLKHSIPGDFNRVTVAEVEQLIAGNGSGRIQR